jgi:hypothetical protein
MTMNEDTEQQQIGFQGGDDDEMPPEMKAHMLAAFTHEAGLGPHPGMYKGPPRRRRADRDEPTDTDRQRAAEEPIEGELSAKKMQAARTGGSPVGLGPGEFEQKQVQQQGALEQQMTTQGAAQAAQARAQQTSVTPPAAPVGPQGTTVPYSAQKGAAGAQMPPPSAPGPEEAPGDEGQMPENP